MSDLLLTHTDDGGKIDGSVTTEGLETAIYLSLFGGNIDDDGMSEVDQLSWWGNKIAKENGEIRSATQFLMYKLPISTSSMRRIEGAARLDLDWLDDFDVSVTISGSRQFVLTVTVNGTAFEFISEVG